MQTTIKYKKNPTGKYQKVLEKIENILRVPYNKTLKPGKQSKINKVGPTSIPESRVGTFGQIGRDWSWVSRKLGQNFSKLVETHKKLPIIIKRH